MVTLRCLFDYLPAKVLQKQHITETKLDRQLHPTHKHTPHTHTKYTQTQKDAQKHLWSSGQSCSFSGDKHLSSSERN